MNSNTRSVVLGKWAVALLLAAPLVLGGCEKEGPMERAGKKVDEAVEKAGDAVEKATDPKK